MTGREKEGERPRRKDQSSFYCHCFFFPPPLSPPPSTVRRPERGRKAEIFPLLVIERKRREEKWEGGEGGQKGNVPTESQEGKRRQRDFFPLRPGLEEVEGVSESGEGEKAAERRTRGASSSSSRAPKKGEWRASLPPSPVENRQSRPRPPSGERVSERVRAD